MRKQLERLRKKGLIDAEDVVKDAGGISGKHRFKIYFAPCVNAPCPRGMESSLGKDSTLVDKPQAQISLVREAEPSLGLDPVLVDNHYLHTEDYPAQKSQFR